MYIGSMHFVAKFAHTIRNFLHHPIRVFWFCFALVFVSLLLNGSLLRIYGLHRDQGRLLEQISHFRAQTQDLENQMKIAQDPSYIERQALDKYDFAAENDLVFVFADE